MKHTNCRVCEQSLLFTGKETLEEQRKESLQEDPQNRDFVQAESDKRFAIAHTERYSPTIFCSHHLAIEFSAFVVMSYNLYELNTVHYGVLRSPSPQSILLHSLTTVQKGVQGSSFLQRTSYPFTTVQQDVQHCSFL